MGVVGYEFLKPDGYGDDFKKWIWVWVRVWVWLYPPRTRLMPIPNGKIESRL